MELKLVARNLKPVALSSAYTQRRGSKQRILTTPARKYKDALEEEFKKHIYAHRIIDSRTVGPLLTVKIYFYLPQGDLFTKKMVPKKWDIDNRYKLLIDSLCTSIGTDDKFIFRLHGEKLVNPSNQYMIVVNVRTYKPYEEDE